MAQCKDSTHQCKRRRFNLWVNLRKMATFSSILAWEIPWTEEPGGLHSMGLRKNRTCLSNWKQQWKNCPSLLWSYVWHVTWLVSDMWAEVKWVTSSGRVKSLCTLQHVPFPLAWGLWNSCQHRACHPRGLWDHEEWGPTAMENVLWRK